LGVEGSSMRFSGEFIQNVSLETVFFSNILLKLGSN
jgi:hypothetical protein